MVRTLSTQSDAARGIEVICDHYFHPSDVAAYLCTWAPFAHECDFRLTNYDVYMHARAGKQTSPVAIAGLLGLAATAGGILLTDSIDIGEGFIRGKIPGGLQVGKLDSTTRLALEVALGLLGLTAFLAGKSPPPPPPPARGALPLCIHRIKLVV